MIALTEIEHAITQLPAEDYAALRRWFLEKDGASWDAQMDLDAAAGKLDFLFEEASAERARGELKEWPSRGGATA